MAKFDNLGESVDKLITIDAADRGVIHVLYTAAREIGGAPLALKAAEALRDAIDIKDKVIVTTGFPIPPTMASETDGPLGTLVLSRALSLALGAECIIVAEKRALSIIEVLAKSANASVGLLDFPLEENDAARRSNELMEELNPAAVIAIEKVGRNRRGIYHNMRGSDVSDRAIKADQLILEAERRNVLTVGIGDGGNEIGMGQIAEAVRKHVPNGEVCNCPCGAGIACETKTDNLVAASVSNWGAYGIAACLAAVTGEAEALHSGEREKNLLMEASRSGAVDGITGKNTPSVDGLDCEVHIHVVELLRELAKNAI